MNFIISGRNIDITPGLRQAVEQKLGKLEKYLLLKLTLSLHSV